MDFDRTAEYAHKHSEEEGKKVRKMIWVIFWVLLAVTAAEVTLGLIWQDIGVAWGIVKWTFIVLTLVKAYYIVMSYMHLGGERKNFKMVVAIPFIIFAVYLIYILLAESLFLNATDLMPLAD
jgi:cytochrome c oxidase subunit IV